MSAREIGSWISLARRFDKPRTLEDALDIIDASLTCTRADGYRCVVTRDAVDLCPACEAYRLVKVAVSSAAGDA